VHKALSAGGGTAGARSRTAPEGGFVLKIFRSTIRGALLFSALLVSWSGCATAQESAIGFVKSTEGIVTVTHGNLTYQAALGLAVYQGDTLRTYWNGHVGVSFKDDTRISLGPSSCVTIPKYLFSPEQQQYGFVLRLLFGTLQYLSGLTAKLSPGAMKIETPTATIGVRGTRFLARAEP
jgi:hypothetical protein